MMLCLISCKESLPVSLEALPENYTLESARKDGCVLHEDGRLTSGSNIFSEFLEKTRSGKAASVRLAYHYNLDPSRVTKEYYMENKDRYPVMFVKDLSYDGEKYTVRHFENGKEIIKEFKYMKCLPFFPKNTQADYTYIKHYVLLDDNSVSSYDEIWKSLASSKFGDYIKHTTVYSEYISE